MTFTVIVCSYEQSENYWLPGYENHVFIWRAKIGSFRNGCSIYKENPIKFSRSIGHDHNTCQISWKLRTFITPVDRLYVNRQPHDTLLHIWVLNLWFSTGDVSLLNVKIQEIKILSQTLTHNLCFSHPSPSLTSRFDQNNVERWRKGTIKMQFPFDMNALTHLLDLLSPIIVCTSSELFIS